MRMKKWKTRKRILASLTAVLMMLSVWPLSLTALAEGEPLVVVSWTDSEGYPCQQVAMPVEEEDGTFWVCVPEDALGDLTVSIYAPDQPDFPMELLDGGMLTDVADAGDTLNGETPYSFLQTVENGQYGDAFFLYISTVTSTPYIQTEEPEPEPEPEP
ncbi:MAG: hypothetical protein IKQ45_05850, partial [Clostridia bacterium]|nr:hypothetical protein [Clostridia bacterium]